MSIDWEIEGGWSKSFCKLPLGEFYASDWQTAWKPLRGEWPEHCFTIASGNIFWEGYEVHLSPNAQTKIGVESHKVICSNELSLIERVSNNQVACVKSHSAEKLAELGRASVLKDDFCFGFSCAMENYN